MWASTKNLVQLIIEDRLDVIKKLLQPYSLNTIKKIITGKEKHCSPLFIAVLKQRASIVDYLLVSCKADPNDVGLFNEQRCPCLLVAAMQNDLQILACLLKNGADVNITNVYHRTALFMAAYNRNYFMVEYLVANCADVNRADYKGTTCLMVALGNDVISRFLIKNGADINRVNHDGRTALMLVVENQNMKGLTFLLSCGADINFKNDYGESAPFIAAMKNQWDIVREFEISSLATNMLEAEVYEMKSCREVIRNNLTETIFLWKKAILLRKLPTYTPLFRTYSSSVVRQDLDWIDNFDHITRSAILFMVHRWSLLNPHTLTILRDAICQIESPAIFVILFWNFLQSLRAADNQLFEKAFLHINLMTSHFLMEWGDSIYVLEIFKSAVLHIENLFQRIDSSTERKTLPLVFQVNSYLIIFIDILNKIISSLPINITDVTEGIKTVVKLDNARYNKLSLLHLCIMNKYPMSLSIFLQCGAEVMRVDKFGKTAVHYMLESDAVNEEAVDIFLEYGFKPEEFKDGFCLPCALRKRKMLQKPVRYMTLQCLAAKVVGQKLPYENNLPISYQNVIYSHF